MIFSRIGPTASEMTLLAQSGNRPRPATQAIRQITATRASQVAAVSSR